MKHWYTHTFDQLIGQGRGETRIGFLVEGQQGQRCVFVRAPGQRRGDVDLVVVEIILLGVAVAAEQGQAITGQKEPVKGV